MRKVTIFFLFLSHFCFAQYPRKVIIQDTVSVLLLPSQLTKANLLYVNVTEAIKAISLTQLALDACDSAKINLAKSVAHFEKEIIAKDSVHAKDSVIIGKQAVVISRQDIKIFGLKVGGWFRPVLKWVEILAAGYGGYRLGVALPH